jgi:hypothetical protein
MCYHVRTLVIPEIIAKIVFPIPMLQRPLLIAANPTRIKSELVNGSRVISEPETFSLNRLHNSVLGFIAKRPDNGEIDSLTMEIAALGYASAKKDKASMYCSSAFLFFRHRTRSL